MQHQRRYLSTLAGFRQTCHAFVNRCIWPKRLWQGTMDSFDDWGQSPKPKVPDSGFDTFKRCMGTLPPPPNTKRTTHVAIGLQGFHCHAFVFA